MSRKIYPKKIGVCEICKDDIIAKNSGFNKPTRRFCSRTCRAKWSNPLRIWKRSSLLILSQKAQQRWKNGVYDDYVKSGMSGEINRLNNLGEKSHFWKGGITPINTLIRNSAKYKNWRTAVFERDNWTCQDCGIRSSKNNSVILNADHIKPFSIYLNLRFDINNGKTLCLNCHKKTKTFAIKAQYQTV